LSHLQIDVSALAQDRADRIRKLARVTAEGIVEIGRYLTEVKEQLEHGQFLDWIKAEFGWHDRSARRFMNVHSCFKLVDVSALYLIAAPKTPEPVRQESIR
jgi:hypothetical protein